jgi:periplasmic protein TonB
MFSNLIESGSHAADLKRKGRFLIGTTLFYGLLLAVTGIGSIYAYNVRLDYDPDYELVALMRFPPVEARAQEPRREQQRAASSPSRSNQLAMRTEISMQTPYHGDRIASASTPEAPPNQAVILGPINVTPEATGGPVGPDLNGSRHGTGVDGPRVTDSGGGLEGPPPLLPTTPKPASPPKQNGGTIKVSDGVISSKIIEKPAPPYPPIAKTAGIFGPVAVQILVDEQGKVISAKATNGNPLLQAAAVQAAYRARFTPTLLSGQPVKVTGSITYNFVLR